VRYVDLGKPLNRNHPLTRDLACLWLPLSNNWGSTKLYDICGLNHGNLTNGPTWINGPYGLSFNGTSNYVTSSLAGPLGATP
jgi:hypothetical protein